MSSNGIIGLMNSERYHTNDKASFLLIEKNNESIFNRFLKVCGLTICFLLYWNVTEFLKHGTQSGIASVDDARSSIENRGTESYRLHLKLNYLQ